MGQTSITNLSNEFQPTVVSGSSVAGQSLTVSSSAVAMLATALAATTQKVVWDLQDDAAFVTFDGTTPTSSNGHKIASGTSGEWSRVTAEAAKWIRETTDARLQISEFQTR